MMPTCSAYRRTMPIVVAIALTLSGRVPAEEGATGFFAGKIDAIDAPARTLTVKSEKSSMTFSVAPDAKIIGRDGRDISLAELAVGNEVTVDYKEEHGLPVAHTITVKAPKTPPPLPPPNAA